MRLNYDQIPYPEFARQYFNKCKRITETIQDMSKAKKTIKVDQKIWRKIETCNKQTCIHTHMQRKTLKSIETKDRLPITEPIERGKEWIIFKVLIFVPKRPDTKAIWY